jgi:hypothetical protein
MNGKKISLGQGVFNFEYFREIIDGAMSTFQGKTCLFFEPFRSVDTDWYAPSAVFALSHSFNVLKVTNGPCQKLDGDCNSLAFP